jgi:hypothetical protein
VSTATLNGRRITTARAFLPQWGCWYVEAAIDSEFEMRGAATVVIADLTLKGTILSGGPGKGRSAFRIVGGAGTWGQTIKSASYADDAGVKFAKVIGEAAAAAGETVGTIDPSLRTGPSFTRRKGVASRVLQILAPQAWYVDELGVTQLGARTPGKLPTSGVTHNPVDRARGTVTLASEKIATILPGIIVDGLTAVDVLHEITAKGLLRSTIWGATSASSSRALDAFRAILDQIDPNRAFRGVTEYRVVTTTGKRLNLQAVRASSGMPDLLRVPARPGVSGCEADVALGSRVLVGFVDSDPSRPYVAGFEDADGAGFVPTTITFAQGTAGIARLGDEITISVAQFGTAGAANGGGAVATALAMKGTISSASSKVRCG